MSGHNVRITIKLGVNNTVLDVMFEVVTLLTKNFIVDCLPGYNAV